VKSFGLAAPALTTSKIKEKAGKLSRLSDTRRYAPWIRVEGSLVVLLHLQYR